MSGDQSGVVVIGYGNTLRQDDGAGIALATKLATTWNAAGIPTHLITDMQLLPEMAAELGEDVSIVVFVDTSAGGLDQTIQFAPLESVQATPSSGHQLDPSILLAYAAIFSGCRPQAWLVTIPGVDFGHGEGYSAQVRSLLDTAAPLAKELLATMKETLPCMN